LVRAEQCQIFLASCHSGLFFYSNLPQAIRTAAAIFKFTCYCVICYKNISSHAPTPYRYSQHHYSLAWGLISRIRPAYGGRVRRVEHTTRHATQLCGERRAIRCRAPPPSARLVCTEGLQLVTAARWPAAGGPGRRYWPSATGLRATSTSGRRRQRTPGHRACTRVLSARPRETARRRTDRATLSFRSQVRQREHSAKHSGAARLRLLKQPSGTLHNAQCWRSRRLTAMLGGPRPPADTF